MHLETASQKKTPVSQLKITLYSFHKHVFLVTCFKRLFLLYQQLVTITTSARINALPIVLRGRG